MFEIEVNLDGFGKLKDTGKHARTAARLAMNRASTIARTAAVKKTTTDYNIKKKDVMKYVTLNKATSSRLEVRFHVSASSIPLLDFTTRAFKALPRQVQRKRKGVRYKVKKVGGTKVLAHSFINKSKSRGSNYVLLREGKSRYPLVPKTVISAATMMRNAKGDEEFVDVFKKVFESNFKHEMSRLMK